MDVREFVAHGAHQAFAHAADVFQHQRAAVGAVAAHENAVALHEPRVRRPERARGKPDREIRRRFRLVEVPARTHECLGLARDRSAMPFAVSDEARQPAGAATGAARVHGKNVGVLWKRGAERVGIALGGTTAGNSASFFQNFLRFTFEEAKRPRIQW